MALGTSEVVPEEFETAIELLARVLRRYEMDERRDRPDGAGGAGRGV